MNSWGTVDVDTTRHSAGRTTMASQHPIFVASNSHNQLLRTVGIHVIRRGLPKRDAEIARRARDEGQKVEEERPEADEGRLLSAPQSAMSTSRMREPQRSSTPTARQRDHLRRSLALVLVS
ncbi:hypothetical protein VTN00DRAFT_834 [Thermoascus crustaceus]|uniref:uncharacterized protein n=1 Tax=Thermoascus crustaceus TaxID=5088 RepID=UPI00374396AE